jgi:hypothetical protein
MTPKTAPCFVHSSWYQDRTRFGFSAPAFIHSATQTPFIAGPLAANPSMTARNKISSKNFDLLMKHTYICKIKHT